MAAAEYFNPNATMDPRSHQPPQQFQQQPPPRASQPSANRNPPYPLSDQPPPYSEQVPRPHSQPPPGQRYPQQTFGAAAASHPYPPNPSNPSNMNTHQYPPEKLPQQHPPPPPWVQQPGYPAPVAPGLSQVYPGQSYPGPAPQTYPSQAYPAQAYPGQTRPQQPRPNSYTRPARSRSQSRERRKHHHKPQPDVRPKKSTGTTTFLGAGGGAIIGDLIFPGMGTLGGALLGGIGGHEYGKKRSASNPSRTSRRSYSHGAEYYDDDYRRGRK